MSEALKPDLPESLASDKSEKLIGSVAEEKLADSTSSSREEQIRFAERLDGALDENIVTSSESRSFSSLVGAWRSLLPEGKSVKESWYKVSADHYESDEVEASNDGVLGGFPELHEPDCAESMEFLRKVAGERWVGKGSGEGKLALDCGAGVGRTSEALLLRFAERVDLVEQSRKLLNVAKESIGPLALRRAFEEPLQNFRPEKRVYDLVSLQWIVGYLLDGDLIRLLQRLRQSLKPEGILFMKENVLDHGDAMWIDYDDNNVIRCASYFDHIFKAAGLRVSESAWQKDWPTDMMPVRMYVLVPNELDKEEEG